MILGKKESEKILRKLIKKSDTFLAKRNKRGEPQEGGTSDSKCFICYENDSGFAFIPCNHTGICIKCGLSSLTPKDELGHYFQTIEPKCPICRKKGNKVIFYEQLTTKELSALSLEEVRMTLEMSVDEFDTFMGYDKLFEEPRQRNNNNNVNNVNNNNT